MRWVLFIDIIVILASLGLWFISLANPAPLAGGLLMLFYGYFCSDVLLVLIDPMHHRRRE